MKKINDYNSDEVNYFKQLQIAQPNLFEMGKITFMRKSYFFRRDSFGENK